MNAMLFQRKLPQLIRMVSHRVDPALHSIGLGVRFWSKRLPAVVVYGNSVNPSFPLSPINR